MNNSNIRFCGSFSMTPQQLYAYKLGKKTKIIYYILAMLFFSIFNDRVFAYIMLTLYLIFSYWVDHIREQQLIKDGDIREEDLQ